MKKIGIFDSGCGGLSLVNALQYRQESFHIVYYADTKCFPWGNKSRNLLLPRLHEISSVFHNQNVDIVIPACHTITGLFQDEFNTIFTQEVWPIFNSTKHYYTHNEYTILVTPSSFNSNIFCKLFQEPHYRIQQIICQDLATHIENHQFEQAFKMLDKLLKNVQFKQVILGCTHYSLLDNAIKRRYPELTIINPIQFFAQENAARIQSNDNHLTILTSNQPSPHTPITFDYFLSQVTH
tara:strand:+ start:180 stop:893 length:714 start_codon:yes stop_codon:yes gene_type:complete